MGTKTKISLQEFKQQINRVQWFSYIGENSDYPHRMNGWEDWRGPESLEVSLIGVWTQELYDSFL